jgi:hypothetical protein
LIVGAVDATRKRWSQLRNGTPGRRFRDFHDRRRRQREDGFSLSRALVVGGGLVLLVGGLAIGWLPGPGGFIAIFGAALLAAEFRPLARLLDACEFQARRAWRWIARRWKRRSRSAES